MSEQTCVICGGRIDKPGRKTCGRECYRILRAQVNKKTNHKGQKHSAEARARNLQRLRAAAEKNRQAIMADPASQRGPQHREAEDWILITPEGDRIHVHNLLDWARENADLFGKRPGDDHDAQVIGSGFGNVKRSLLGSKKPPVRSYKGWSLEIDGCSYMQAKPESNGA
ncbi:hypothetical protein BISA_1380 [Bifidobacterium saguini DSM 23967]|uniref:Uncharacterized protein n=1 Tax=Bifidobacterium saguini DSM 23967 TaxID=1437607 RepID=A0A087DCG4_9BIFI|nr:hypothetical protein [Bifidobacterium saguini]KFI93214.1 hypothetical protein BISA_1380 [Bifidobacterium saguini DSM 23967]